MPRSPAACRCVFVFLICLMALSPVMADAHKLTNAVAAAMAGRHGAAVVVDVRTGRVLAAYHPEVAARRVVHPGSALKPFTLLTLLEAGKVDARTALMCKRPLTIGGHKLDCTHPETALPQDPAVALAYSCNSYFTEVATRLTPQQLRDSLEHLGFTSATGLEPNEATGTVALAQSPAQLQLQAIGECGIRVTPLELLLAYRNLALLAANAQNGSLAPLFDGLQQSVSYGMGRLAQPSSPMKVAGKTGTALADEGPWTHAWFAGYAPASQPEIALVVYLEKGHGPSDAAMIAREMFAAFAGSKVEQPASGAGR